MTIHIGSAVGQSYPATFEATGSRPIFDGFLKIYHEAVDDSEVPAEQTILSTSLPTLSEGESLAIVTWHKTEQTTRAPERYSEAALVQALERRGIGRPATYAPTISLLKEKGYVARTGKRLSPTETGQRLCAFLIAQFPTVFEYKYTAWLEAELDKLAAGQSTRLNVMKQFWGMFKPSLNTVGGLVNQHLAERPQPKLLGASCPKCGKPLVERNSQYGKFAACTGYPGCRYTAPLTSSPVLRAAASAAR